MSPRKRNRENKGLPARWRFRAGKYRYQVPKGLEHLWDGKKEFTLGKTLPEAHRVWASRVDSANRVTTMGDLLERYEREVVPQKKKSTQRGQPAILTTLRGVFGGMRPHDIKPHHAYSYFDKRSAKTAAKREIEVLRHALSMAVRWGVIDKNPLLKELELELPKSKQEYVTDEQILAVLSLEPKGGARVIQAYISLKLLTALRRTDLLRLQLSDLHESGIVTEISKTGDAIELEWTPRLREAVAECKAARPIDLSPWLFCTRKGQPYIKADASANGFESLWQRTMKKVADAEGKAGRKFKRFPERALRNKCATDADSLQHAQELLAHASAETTRRWYRLKPEKVKPLG